MRTLLRRLILAWLLLQTGAGAAAGEIDVLALTSGKAILSIDGQRRVLEVGDTSPEGVKLIRADTERAEIEIGGRRETLQLRTVVAPLTGGNEPSVTLWADTDGFYYAYGSINGSAVRFLVDTGADTVAMNRALAERLGLDYRAGQQGVATTAGGYVKVYRVKLDRVTVGEVTLRHVDAGVIDGDHPQTPLLGMSFLGQLKMQRDGRKMELIKK